MSRQFTYDRSGNATLTCACGATVTIKKSASNKTMPADALPKMFSDRGWIVGSSPKKDRCKQCRANDRQAKVVQRQSRRMSLAASELELIENQRRPAIASTPIIDEATPGAAARTTHFEETQTVSKPQLVVPATPDRDKTKSDIRLINLRIEDVDLDEDRGYMDGWNDLRVAAELAMPLEWVAEVREANFGENKTVADQAVQPLLDALAEAKAENEELATRLDEVCQRHVEISKELQALREGFKKQGETIALNTREVGKIKSIAA